MKTDNYIIEAGMSYAKIKKLARINFDGSQELFNACWRQYMTWLNGAIDDPKALSDVINWLDQIASEKVNNPKSRFYIYG